MIFFFFGGKELLDKSESMEKQPYYKWRTMVENTNEIENFSSCYAPYLVDFAVNFAVFFFLLVSSVASLCERGASGVSGLINIDPVFAFARL